MHSLHLDIETFSTVPIEHGTFRYAEGAEIMLFQYALDDERVAVWDVTDPREAFPDDLGALLADSSIEIVAHNAVFERTMFRLARLAGDRPPYQTECILKLLARASNQIERWHCTMARAHAHSLPGALGKLCEILGLPQDQAKDKAGKRLIHLLTKPLPKNQKLRRATRETHPQEWQQFREYAAQDVVAMREVYKKLPMWNYRTGGQRELWWLDQKINDRGIRMDQELAHAALRATTRAQARLANQVQELTDGEIQRATQRDALLQYILEEHDVHLADIKGSTIDKLLEDPDFPPEVKELLYIRQQAASASTAKYKRVVQCSSRDGRLRGTTQWRGALRTGRWAGRIFQPQNLPSRGLPPQDKINLAIECMLNDCEDLVFDNVMELTVGAIRGLIAAEPGRKKVVADLSNIEGRDQAWIAGEEWKLQAFRDYDASLIVDDQGRPVLDKKGERQFSKPDLYVLSYARAFNVDPKDVTKDMRQIGKVMELFLGYQGGVGAYLTGALTYGFDVEDLANRTWNNLPLQLRYEAEDFLEWTYEKKRPRFGLSDKAFIAVDTLKRGWREAHPNIVRFWKLLEDTIRTAIECPGFTFACGHLKIRRDGSWLRIGLPSGRALCYPGIRIDERDGAISYMGVHQYTRQWTRIRSYAGKFFENVCQAVAADVLADNMPAIEDAGYLIDTTVHDEVVTDTPDSPEFTHLHLAEMLARNPQWAPDMPLAAAGFEAYRYRKG
jgi:DNA polymerase bacteriophage-type